MRICLYRGRLHKVCGGPKRWDIPRSSIPLGVFRRALEQRKAALEALHRSSSDRSECEHLAVLSTELDPKQQHDKADAEDLVNDKRGDVSLSRENRVEDKEDDKMEDDAQLLQGRQESEQNDRAPSSAVHDPKTGKILALTAERKRKREEVLGEKAERRAWKQEDDDNMEVEGLHEARAFEKEATKNMDIDDDTAHAIVSEKDTKEKSASASDIKDALLAGKQEISYSLGDPLEMSMDLENGYCKTQISAPQEQGDNVSNEVKQMPSNDVDDVEKEKLIENKRQKRAELEARLKHLTSEKHRLVQMLKQVLNEEESRKQGHAILQSPTSIGSHANAEGATGPLPASVADPEIAVTRADLEEGELDFTRSPSPHVHTSLVGSYCGPARTSVASSGSGLGRSLDSPQNLSQGVTTIGVQSCRAPNASPIACSAPGGSSTTAVSVGMTHASHVTHGGHSYSSNVLRKHPAIKPAGKGYKPHSKH